MARVFAAASYQFLIGAAPATAYPFSLSAWVKLTSGPAAYSQMNILGLSVSTDAYDRDMLCVYNDGSINTVAAYSATDSGTYARAYTAVALATGEWHHVCAVFASATSRAVYLDGANKVSNTTSISPTTRNALGVGARYNSGGPADFLSAAVAEAVIWDVALSDADVAALAAENPPPSTQSGDQVTYCPFVDDDTDTLGGTSLTAYNSPTYGDHVPQYARPIDVVSSSNWTGDETAVDEVYPNDSDYITGSNSANGTIEFQLTELADPESSNGHTIKIRARESASRNRGITVYLVEGSTVRSTWVASSDLGTSFAEYSTTISSGDADSITDYADLRLRITSTGDVGTPAGTRSYVYVSWMQFEVPYGEAGTPPVTVTLDTATLTAGGQSLTLVPGAVTTALDTATLTAGGQALAVAPGTATIALATALLTAAGQSTGIVPGAATVALATALLTASGVKIVIGAGGSPQTIVLSTATATAGGQALTVAPGAVTVGLDTASLTAAGIATVIVPGAAAVALATAALTTAGIQLDVVPGAVAIDLATATITAAGIKVTINASGAAPQTIVLDTATLTAAGIVLGVVPGAATIPIDTAALTAAGQALGIVPGAVTTELGTASLAAAGQAMTVAPGEALIALATGQLTTAGQSLTVIPGAVSVALDTAQLTALGIALIIEIVNTVFIGGGAISGSGAASSIGGGGISTSRVTGSGGASSIRSSGGGNTIS